MTGFERVCETAKGKTVAELKEEVLYEGEEINTMLHLRFTDGSELQVYIKGATEVSADSK